MTTVAAATTPAVSATSTVTAARPEVGISVAQSGPVFRRHVVAGQPLTDPPPPAPPTDRCGLDERDSLEASGGRGTVPRVALVPNAEVNSAVTAADDRRPTTTRGAARYECAAAHLSRRARYPRSTRRARRSCRRRHPRTRSSAR